MTQSTYDDNIELAKSMAAVGLSYSIWEIIACFVLSKSLNSMWILVNTSQFLAFISMWAIQLPSLSRFLLNELKRIYLGEFLDDLEIS